VGKTDIPADKTGLTLAADVSDVNFLSTKIIDLMKSDLINALRNLNYEIGALGIYYIFKDSEGKWVVQKDPPTAEVEGEDPPPSFKINDELMSLFDNGDNSILTKVEKMWTNSNPASGESYGF
jgi:hypothetical protein